jgi:hypothetical protein
MGSTPVWQVFFSTLGGTLVGFFLALVTTALRERANLRVRIQEPKERVYVVENKPASGRWSYVVTTPAEATEAVLTIELVIVNASAAYDAVTGAELYADGQRVPARSRADSSFTGVNIPPRQSVTQRVRFFLPKPGTRSRDNLDIETPSWIWSEEEPFPDMRLRWTSVRRRMLGWREISGDLPVSGPWMTLHEPGIDIGYLHSTRA